MKTLVIVFAATTMSLKGIVPDTFEEVMTTADSVRLYTYGVRPAEGKKCAIVIQRNPYVKDMPVDLDAFAKSQEGHLARGYAYIDGGVVQCMSGEVAR